MEIDINDPFDESLSVRGLGVLLTYMHTDIYEYTYYATFRNAMKPYSRMYKDSLYHPIEDLEWFRDIDDPFVRLCFGLMNKLGETKTALVGQFQFDPLDDQLNRNCVVESNRFRPFLYIIKKPLCYDNLKFSYQRTLPDFLKSMYQYACAFTARTYDIPAELLDRLQLPDDELLKLVDHSNANVTVLAELIKVLQKNITEMVPLMTGLVEGPDPPIYTRRRKRP